jgi:probable rRNA maturation factor
VILKRDVKVSYAGARRALAVPTVRRAVTRVLDDQAAGPALMTVTFLSAARMRTLNRRTFGRDAATDVIAFRLPHPDTMVGDVYVCPAVARRSARQFHVSPRQELLRLVVHGTLHVLGHDHPDGAARTRSPMWTLQEAYVRDLLGGDA